MASLEDWHNWPVNLSIDTKIKESLQKCTSILKENALEIIHARKNRIPFPPERIEERYSM